MKVNVKLYINILGLYKASETVYNKKIPNTVWNN